jgi:hypothetical protein
VRKSRWTGARAGCWGAVSIGGEPVRGGDPERSGATDASFRAKTTSFALYEGSRPPRSLWCGGHPSLPVLLTCVVQAQNEYPGGDGGDLQEGKEGFSWGGSLPDPSRQSSAPKMGRTCRVRFKDCTLQLEVRGKMVWSRWGGRWPGKIPLRG